MKQIKHILFGCAVIIIHLSLLFTACDIISFEPYDKEYYYGVEGVGYIINGETNEPFLCGTAFYRATTESLDCKYCISTVTDRKFEADKTGFFRVKFLKRINRKNVVSYGYPINLRYKGEELTLSMVKNAKGIIQLDTIKIFPDTIIIAENIYYENASRLGKPIESIYADNGIWKIEDGIDWLTLGRLFYPNFYELWAVPLPGSATECRSAIITAEYPNGRKDKYIVVQAPREMGYKPNCY